MVRSIGDAIGRPAHGEAIAHDIEQRAERVRRRSASAPRVRFAYLIWRKPWMSVNADTFAHALLELAGGANVFGDRPVRYPEVTAEALAEAEPELVLLSTEPFPFEAKHADELARLTGLARSRFALADGEYLSWHGSRTPAGIDYAAGLIESARRR
jgi:ABC-type Fe3+-hydroxamate transport system substrate-binding protein